MCSAELLPGHSQNSQFVTPAWEAPEHDAAVGITVMASWIIGAKGEFSTKSKLKTGSLLNIPSCVAGGAPRDKTTLQKISAGTPRCISEIKNQC